MAYLTRDQIDAMGFHHVGKNSLLSDKASYYNCNNISIANNTRIDDFAVLSAGVGGIEIGSYVHIAVGVLLIGSAKITIKDFSGLSSRVSVYSSSDDYSGEYMTNPMIPEQFTNVNHAEVTIGRHVIIGAGSIILPGVNLADGVAIGALSLVNKSCEEFGVYIGTPIKKVKNRSKNILEIEEDLYKFRLVSSDAK